MIKIRLLPKQPIVPRSLLEERMTRCCALVDAYLVARKQHRRNETLTVLHEISHLVPPGVYQKGGDQSGEMYAVLGVRETERLSDREVAFEVPYIRIHAKGEMEKVWKRSPLIGTEGFIVPVIGNDRYSGARWNQVGYSVYSR